MQVTRNRRPAGRTKTRVAVASLAAVAVTGSGLAYASTTQWAHRQVAQTYSDGIQVSDNQVIQPLGQRTSTPYGKFMGSQASPDGRFLAASSSDRSIALQVFDLKTHQLVSRAGSAKGADLALKDTSVGQESPTWSPDGKYVWLSQKNAITRIAVGEDGSLSNPTSFALPKVDKDHANPLDNAPQASALPAKAAYSPDGKTLYVALNGQNTVVAMDPTTGAITRTWKVGIAPRQLVFVGNTLYVSNEGGRHAMPGETTMNSYGTDVPANAFTGASTTGSLSVIDPSKDAVGSIKVGLHPTAMYTTGHALFVANTFGDTVSVVDTHRKKVVQTLQTQPWSGSKVGYEPTAISMTNDGRLLVTLARANAVAVYRYWGNPQEPMSLVGLLPTDYFPTGLTVQGSTVTVANTRGIDAQGPAITYKKGANTPVVTGHGTHATTASVTWFTMPSDRDVRKQTAVVFKQNGWNSKDLKTGTGRKVKAVPVPARIGDPSTIKHVFMIVKENRTYDQLYGDIASGNGDPSLAQFGANVTPNQHALAKQFGLYDNTYDIGTNSAEGHNWIMQGDDPAYTESSVGEYERSYDTEDDVLGHQRSGFLWGSIEKAGHTARNYGEFDQWLQKPDGATWQKYYCATKAVEEGKAAPSTLSDPSLLTSSTSPIPSLQAINATDVPKFDVNIPDQYRYEMWKQHFEKEGPANFNMIWFSSDHTGGAPDARAQVADNDLAVGKMVQEISHSKYWKDSAIFVVEDDSQDGADHVDGHRAPVQVISPWAAHGTTVSTYYSQINMVRTIQQILGAQPLNQKLAAATPMYDAFSSKPDFRPFTAVPNQVPLTENVKDVPACGVDTPAVVSAAAQVPASAKPVAAQWETWRKAQGFSSKNGVADSAHPAQMSRFTWYQAHSFTTPYPGDKKVFAPNEVPGAVLPGHDGDR